MQAFVITLLHIRPQSESNSLMPHCLNAVKQFYITADQPPAKDEKSFAASLKCL